MKDIDAYILLLEQAENEDAQLQMEKENLLRQMEQMMARMAEIDQERMVIATAMGYIKSKRDIPSSSSKNVLSDTSTHTVHTSMQSMSLRERLKAFFNTHEGLHSPAALVAALKVDAQAGSIRTGINSMYQAGLLGRVPHKGASYQYAAIHWLKASRLVYKTFDQDRKVKTKSKKQK